MEIRLAATITTDSIVDGVGIRAVIWTQGCPHGCKGCHNPHTHSYDGGFDMAVSDVIQKISQLKLHKGITFSGGEPLEQALACAEIAKNAKQMGLDIWLYTGYIFEDIIEKSKGPLPEWGEILKYIDIMIDGPYVEEKKNYLLQFRGSENQRMIDVKKSLQKGEAVMKV